MMRSNHNLNKAQRENNWTNILKRVIYLILLATTESAKWVVSDQNTTYPAHQATNKIKSVTEEVVEAEEEEEDGDTTEEEVVVDTTEEEEDTTMTMEAMVEGTVEEEEEEEG